MTATRPPRLIIALLSRMSGCRPLPLTGRDRATRKFLLALFGPPTGPRAEEFARTSRRVVSWWP